MKKHWLVRPENIRKLWIVGGIVLALTVIAQLFLKIHAHFDLDGVFGFNAIFGFVSCVAMVFAAKFLGKVLKRRDSYYDD